jgi:hypothetical protein
MVIRHSVLLFTTAAGLSGGLCAPLRAAELKIVDVKAYAYLEREGRLSDNLIGEPRLINAPRGGAAPGGDTATAVLLDFVFQGDKNATPKYATATIDLVQTNRDGQNTITHKAFTNFVFGPDGVQHKAVFLDGATCMPLAIEVHAGHTAKSARLDFQCDVVHATD